MTTEIARLRRALAYYADPLHYDSGDVPGHIYVLDDGGRLARGALGLPANIPVGERFGVEMECRRIAAPEPTAPDPSAPEPTAPKLTMTGKDNYGRPRQDYADKLAGLDEAGYLAQAEQAIWLAAFASNNPRSDYHWQADACYDEAVRRGNPNLYTQAHAAASKSG
jgi:hypothetical protein